MGQDDIGDGQGQKIQDIFVTADTLAQQRPLADRAKELKSRYVRDAVTLDELLPTLGALDAYAQQGLRDAIQVNPVLSGSTASVYVQMSDVLGGLESGQEETGYRVTRFAALAASAAATTANTAISTQTTTSIPDEEASTLLSWNLPQIQRWIQAIREWDSGLGERLDNAVTAAAAVTPTSAALAAREVLNELERLLIPGSEWTNFAHHIDRWESAPTRYIEDEVAKRNLLARAAEANSLVNDLTKAGKVPRMGVRPHFDAAATRGLIKAAINLTYDWVVALKEAGWSSERLGDQR